MSTPHQPISEEIILHRSKLILFVKGLWAWFMCMLLFYIVYFVLQAVPQFDPVIGSFGTQNAITLGTIILSLLLLLYGAVALYVVLSWINEFFVLKDNSVAIHWGVIAHKELSYDSEEIDSISVKQTWLGRILNIGSIVMTSPKIEKDIVLKSLASPHEVAEKIHQLSFRYRKLVHGNLGQEIQ